MHVFVAGATGALGRPLVRLLIEKGHSVTGLTQFRPEVVEQLGARPAVGNALDAAVLTKLVTEAAPEAVVHALTRIPQSINITPAKMRLNDLIRIKGTLNLIEASKGASKLVAGSVTFVFRGRSEDKMQPLHGMGPLQRTIEAVQSLERQVLEARGMVLRFGYFYGPGPRYFNQRGMAGGAEGQDVSDHRQRNRVVEFHPRSRRRNGRRGRLECSGGRGDLQHRRRRAAACDTSARFNCCFGGGQATPAAPPSGPRAG